MKKISRKEFLKKDVYIMYRSTTERTSILKLIEDNLKSVKWSLTEEKPTEINANEVFVKNPSMGFINIKEGYIYIPTYSSANDENKLLLTYSEFVDIVNSFNIELLTGYEKQYITDIIKASKLKVDYVVKKNAESAYDLIRFEEDGDGITTLYFYGILTTFKSLDEGEKYTLEQLGLIEPKKITLKAFFESEKPIAIHCDTEEKANELLQAFHNLGKKWCDDTSYLSCNEYDDYKDKTCYSNQCGYAERDFYQKNSFKIYEFDEVALEN